MELSQLRAFLSVLESGSLQHASKALGISRSTLHARISGLEESLGRKVLVRTHRGVEPTEFGGLFAAQARALLGEADKLARFARRQSEEVLGELYLRSAVGFPPQLLMSLATSFARLYPDLTMRMEVDARPAEAIPADVDVALHFGPAVPAGPYRTFALVSFPERLLASRRYLERHGRPRALEDLMDHRLMSWWPAGEDGHRLPLRRGGTVEFTPALVSNEVYVLRSLAAADQGIALLPDADVARGVVPGEALEGVLDDLVGRQSSVWVLVPEAQAETPRSRAAVRMLREIARCALCRPEASEGATALVSAAVETI